MGRDSNRFVKSVAPLALVLALSGTFSSLAQAANVQQDLDTAEAAYADLDYEKANKLVDAVVKQRGLTHEQLVRAYRILGRTHAVLGHDQPAQDAFKLLITYNPDEKTDASQPPKIQDAFSQARGFWAGYTVRPGVEVSAVIRPSAPGVLRVTTRDPTRVAKKVVVGFRWGPIGNFTTTSTQPGDGVTVDVPAPPPNVSRLDYFAEAQDDRDDVVFEAGHATAPKTAMLELAPGPGPGPGPGPVKPESHSIFSSPVFWIVAGAVVAAGAGTGIYFATRKAKDETLPPTGATFAPFLFCGGTSDGRCH